LKIVYENPDELHKGSNPIIGRYVFENIPGIDGSQEVDLRIKFKHNSNGITNLVKAEIVETKEIEVEVPEEPEPKPPQTEQKNTTPQTGDQPPPTGVQTQTDPEKKDGDTPMKEAPRMVKKKKTETKYHPIKFIKFTAGLAPEQIETFKKLEEKWLKEDLYVFQVAEAKNRLETYIYDSRDKLKGNWSSFVTQQEVDVFTGLLDTSLSWFEANQEETLDAYLSKLGELQAWGSRFQKRFFEYEELPSAFNQLTTVIETYKTKHGAGAPEHAHISKEKMDQIPTECDRVFGLIKEGLDKQSTQPKTADPIVFSTDIRERAKNLAKFCEEILNTPKPKPPPEPKTTNSPQSTPENNSNSTQEPPKSEENTTTNEGDNMDTFTNEENTTTNEGENMDTSN